MLKQLKVFQLKNVNYHFTNKRFNLVKLLQANALILVKQVLHISFKTDLLFILTGSIRLWNLP